MANYSSDKFQIIGCNNLDSEGILRPSLTYWQDAWRRLRKNKVAIISLIALVLMIIMSIVGPMIANFQYQSMNKGMENLAPNSTFWFGTDVVGRDLFSRVWVGGRISISIGIIGAICDTVIGVIYGGVAGYNGGIIDDIMMRIVEILASIPYLVLVILIRVVFDKGGIFPLILAMAITGWTGMARLVRGQILQIKEQEYVLAAKALGANSSRIIAKHLIPNTLGIMIVAITFAIPGYMFSEAFLSFLGLGVKSPMTSWGALAQMGQQQMRFYPYQLIFPALAISITMLSFQLLGDGLRDALDPKLRQ
ncbi:MAG: ABC transporter permease [Clostridium sp.]|uniref:ABC transporter permease n=1 Tax=Clostridium culturomicium TaxID=1499683 RepID=UPI00058B2B2B|nr:ABC transporter permease [Clostridium culturomicium]MDU4892055.1 ABC transporter permease [Clostridium sp.]MDU7082442.1 ABC transporter permease [Clostridium sp.]